MKKIWMMLLLCLAMVACTRQTSECVLTSEEGKEYLYYPSVLLTGVVLYESDLFDETSEDMYAQVDKILLALRNVPQDNQAIPVLSEEIKLQDVSFDQGILTIDLSQEYLNLQPDREILSREAMVLTFLQLNGVRMVAFQVDGMPLSDADGVMVGPLDESSFVTEQKLCELKP